MTKRNVSHETINEPFEEAAPTLDEAMEMFKENQGLSSVVTDRGILHKDGSIT